MFELTYDILDDLGPRTTNSVEKLIAEIDNSLPDVMCTHDFYTRLSEEKCTHLLLLKIEHKKGMSIRKTREMLNDIKYRFFDNCSLDVISVAQFPDINRMEYLTNPLTALGKQISIDDERPSAATEYVEFKIPIKIDKSLSIHRTVWNVLNFLSSTYSVFDKYNDCRFNFTIHEIRHDAPEKDRSEFGYQIMPFNSINVEDIYAHKHHSECEYEYDHNPNKRQRSTNGLIIQMFEMLNCFYYCNHKEIEIEFNKWWKKYQKISPTPYVSESIFEIVNAE